MKGGQLVIQKEKISHTLRGLKGMYRYLVTTTCARTWDYHKGLQVIVFHAIIPI